MEDTCKSFPEIIILLGKSGGGWSSNSGNREGNGAVRLLHHATEKKLHLTPSHTRQKSVTISKREK